MPTNSPQIKTPIFNRIFLINGLSLVVSVLIIAATLAYLIDAKERSSPPENMEAITYVFLGLIMFSYVLSVVSILWLRRKIFNPLSQMISDLSELQAQHLPHEKNDEISFFGSSIKELIKSIKEREKESAITMTIQMLAHDIRKPLAMVKLILSILKRSENTKIPSLDKFYLEVQKSITNADQLISDVMDYGNTNALKLTPFSLGELLAKVLEDCCMLRSDASLSFVYEFNHNYLLHADRTKVYRILSNIITNAFQAMAFSGRVEFYSTDADTGFLTLAIKNNNSFVSKNALERLFTAFFTANKKGGTGLGLAIVKKLVEEHNGKVWCESCEIEKTTIFFVSLPCCSIIDKFSGLKKLPSYSTEFALSYQVKQNGLDNAFTKANQTKGLATIANRMKRKIRLGILDDEKAYAVAFHGMLELESLQESLEIIAFDNCSDTLFSVKSNDLDCLICDIDLNEADCNGFDLVTMIRAGGYKIPICLHSNRNCTDDHKRAVESGAHSLIAKPMNYGQLSDFLINALASQ